MQYTGPLLHATNKQAQLDVKLAELAHAFANIPDPRRAQGRVYWLPSLLCLAVAAILCNSLSVLAIAQWIALQPPAIRAALGLPKDRTPNQSTLHRLFRRLQPEHLNRALADYFEQAVAGQRERAAQAVAVDGKARRGQLQFEPDNAATIHEVEAFCHDVGVVLLQLVLDNQHGEAELSAAPKLIAGLNWQGRVVTGDALYCQVSLCEQVVAAGGDYLVVVKGNQPQLLADLELLFGAPEMSSASAAKRLNFDYRASSTLDKGHGRSEQRRAIASTELTGYSRWPALAQVVQISRQWQRKGKTHQGTHYLVTSIRRLK